MAHTRATDDNPFDPDSEQRNKNGIRVTREIPLWGILTVLGALGAQGVAIYYGQQRTAEAQSRQETRTAEIAADVRSIVSENNKSSIKTVELSFQMQALEQRVRVMETLTAATRAQVASGVR